MGFNSAFKGLKRGVVVSGMKSWQFNTLIALVSPWNIYHWIYRIFADKRQIRQPKLSLTEYIRSQSNARCHGAPWHFLVACREVFRLCVSKYNCGQNVLIIKPSPPTLLWSNTISSKIFAILYQYSLFWEIYVTWQRGYRS